MHQDSGQTRQPFRDFAQRRQRCEFTPLRFVYPKIASETVFEKVVLFPNVKLGIEFGGQMLLHFDADRLRQSMECRDLIERRFVKRTADQPAFMTITVEIAFAQIFDPDETFRWIVKINLRHPNVVGIEEVRDLDIMPVFFARQIVFHQDERLVRRAMNPIKFAIRSAPVNRGDLYFRDIETRKMHPCSSNEQGGYY